PLTYNGAMQAVVVTGLPAGVSVADYIGNVRVVPGRYTASVVLAYDLDNYERPAIPDLIWEIAKARYDMGGARWDYAGPFVFDGTEKTVSVTGLPEGVSVRGYSPQNQATVVGAYTTFVQFDYDESTHEAPEMAPLHWSIVPARYDMSAARWNYTAPFVYDGKAKSVQVTGLPAGVRVVSYTGNTAAAVGAYTARVTLAGQEGFEQPVLPSLAWKIAAPAAPPAVKAVRVEATGGSSLQVTWTPAAGASGYELWWNTASSGTYTLAKATTALTFTKTYLQPGIRYFFKVRPYMLAGTVKVFGPYSAAAAGVPLAKAVISVAAAVGKDQIRLAWGAVPKAGGYQVYVSGTAGGTYVPLKATTATTLLVTGLKPGTAYYFKVAAYGKFYSVTYFGPASAFRGVKTLAR
ncbi:MAG TPA: fibronectin type III domain-containing protein, partial [Candidatus Limnocylindria bacterium]|nr:fibronectin type III domain-containing protein [Candidatus Limnocylindria bacterium]